MATVASRKARGMRTQAAVAEWFAARGWPFAQPAGAGRNGSDVTGMLDCAVEVKAAREFSPMAWVRQARAGRKAGETALPFAVYRPDGLGEERVGEWLMILRLDDGTRLLREAGYGDQKATG